MRSHITCSCCGLPVAVTEKHIGHAVACPRSGKHLLVGRKTQRNDRRLILLAGLTALPFIACIVALLPRPKPERIERPVVRQETQILPVIKPVPPLPAVVKVILPLPREVAPVPHEPAPAVAEVAPATRRLPPEPRYVTRHEIRKRLDLQSAEELEERLLAVAELSLDGDANRKASKWLTAHAAERLKTKLAYVGPLALGKTRPELAGLPYCIGPASVLPKEKAVEMETVAKQLRETFQRASGKQSIVRSLISSTAASSEIGRLYASLSTEKSSSGWATEKAVPCIRQMLQVENRDVRRMSCELLRDLQTPESTAALVQWAVFDTDAANRAAALSALRGRERQTIAEQLSKYLRYPWAPAVEHACEALVSLECTEAIPQILAAKEQPDPDAPYEVTLPHGTGGIFRQEMVRVNHAKNCLLCHAPSLNASDSLRAAVPDSTKPLPPPSSVAYYNSGGELVAASTTYLRQDFSVVQPVAKHGPWPKNQRFDYFVAVRRELHSDAVKLPRANSQYQRAYDFALNGLGAAVPDVTASTGDSKLAETARFVSLQLHPEALHALKSGKSLLEQSPSDVIATTVRMQHRHGAKANRIALVAYFAEAVETGTEAERVKALRMLTVARSSLMDHEVPAKLAQAAKPSQ